jgi:hypothetical protein
MGMSMDDLNTTPSTQGGCPAMVNHLAKAKVDAKGLFAARSKEELHDLVDWDGVRLPSIAKAQFRQWMHTRCWREVLPAGWDLAVKEEVVEVAGSGASSSTGAE